MRGVSNEGDHPLTMKVQVDGRGSKSDGQSAIM